MSKASLGFDTPRDIPLAEITASLSCLQPTLPTHDGQRKPQRISDLQLDNFQVALVPSQPGDAAAVGWTRNPDISRVLFLPMTWRQLIFQVHKEMDRTSSPRKEEVIRFGDVTVNLTSMEVRRSKRVLKLTALEFKVLKFFLLNPNRVISRPELLDSVWGYENYPCTRTVDNHILRLRRLLEADLANPVYFHTVHCVGYKFVSAGQAIA